MANLMTTSVSEHIEQASDELSAELCEQLVKRRGGAFASMGAPAARRLVAKLLAALAADVEHGANEQTRRAVAELLDVPQSVQLGWHDLRLLLTSLRKALFARLDHERDVPPSATRALEDLLSHATFQIGLGFVTQREEIIEKQAGQLEVRLAELAALDAEKTRVLEQAQELSQRLDSILANVPALVWETRFGDGSATPSAQFVSEYVKVLTGYDVAEWYSTSEFWLTITHPDDKRRALAETGAMLAADGGVCSVRWITKDGRTIHVEISLVPIKDEAGALVGVRGVTVDVTSRRQAAEAEGAARLREEIIRMQAARLDELSAPFIPITEKVMVMPLIGGIDHERAQRVIDALLQGVERTGASVAIIDITGVREVDSHTADVVLRAAKSVRLLGAQVVLTGIRPEVAQTLVHLGIDLSGLVTKGTLQSGIAHAVSSAW
ncbi:uncharacterized protein SOCE836_106370 [Sorangium cellulosum]|uniref:Anti-anti-sigma factor n=2 Tax=Polyangiaceae TaxID=49 RepID=A0A4P2R8D1_SORCE|nr:uncharacterized protein SOCE836_106370 [Sorangium cellulosum]WCQ97681.1 hypothetical protein NQZ70_10477 [Sorangium sp. Soce836]